MNLRLLAAFLTVGAVSGWGQVTTATFYGSVEFYVREPGGNVVGFAAFK